MILSPTVLLEQTARKLGQSQPPQELLTLVVQTLDRTLQLTHSSVLVLDARGKRYTFVDSRGTHRLPMNLIKIEVDHPLIHWLHSCRKERVSDAALFMSRLDQVLREHRRKQGRDESVRQLERMIALLRSLKVVVCVPGYFEERLLSIFLLGRKRNGRTLTKQEVAFAQTLAHHSAFAIRHATHQQETFYETVQALALQIAAKDPCTFGHLTQVEQLGFLGAQALGLNIAGRGGDILRGALRLHDIGKVAIPDSILKKRGSLNPGEWRIMKTHVEQGVKLLAPLTNFREVAQIIRYHHERMDGAGYPHGAKGEEIPIEARLITVVDAYHAMVSDRPYHKGISQADAFRELERCKGTQFDLRVVDSFIPAVKRAGL